MTDAVLAGLGGLVLLVQGNDVLPGREEVGRLVPEVGQGGNEVFEGGVVGVVDEEGVEGEGE